MTAVSAGQIILADHNNDLNTTVALVRDAWSTWTPILTNLTLGSGTVTARYRTVGKTMDWRFKFVYGAGSAVGTAPRFTLPGTPHSSYAATEDILGWGTLLDSGTANYAALVRLVSGTTAEIFRETDTSHATITSTAPFTWTTNDVLSVGGTIELA